MPPPDTFSTHHVTSAREFLRELTTSTVFSPPQTAVGTRWVYRGQAEFEWPLVSSALREPVSGPFPTRRTRAESELRQLAAFYERADQSGIEIPENSQALRKQFRDVEAELRSNTDWEWPPRSLLSVMALAQHYGVRTRLLDWTTSPLIAAYFAAKSACLARARERVTSKRLVVFGAMSTWLERTFEEDAQRHETLVELVRAPHAGNPNLHAQNGIFTILRTQLLGADEEEPPLPLWDAENFDVSALTLPWGEAPALLYLLSHLGVSAASVFPGFAGVVESLDEEKYWPREFLYQRPQYHSDFWGGPDEDA